MKLYFKKILKIRFLENSGHIFQDSQQYPTHYSLMEKNQGMSIFLPNASTSASGYGPKGKNQEYMYVFVNENEKADICILGIQHINNSLLRDNEFNILICVENLSVGRQHYQHFNKFNRYNNEKIHLYYYNDVTYIDKRTIPIPLCFMKQFMHLSNSNIYDPILTNTFEDKLFCLFISKNNLNQNKQHIVNELVKIGQVHHISLYDHLLLNKSCYNSPELLKVFNKYKFVMCLENSKTPGYLTEKIFNIFLSKSIPIYDGAPDICAYINKDTFINYDDSFIEKVKLLNDNKELYENYINTPKLNTEHLNLINVLDENLNNIFHERFMSSQPPYTAYASDYASNMYMFLNEDYLTNWVDKNNGLCITRTINNLNTFNFNTQSKFPVILTGYTNIINYFFNNIIQHIKTKIVLILIESDIIYIPLNYIEHPNVLHIFTWNKQIQHKKVSAIPIGLNFKRQYKSIIEWVSLKNKKTKDLDNHNVGNKLVCYNCSLHTSNERKILQGVIYNKMKDFCKELDYIPFLESKMVPSCIEGQLKIDITNPICYNEWIKYKFILSPEGAGLDCHRTWEAVIVGIIPIVKSSSIDEIYQDLPILVVNDWNELSVEFLNEQYQIINENIKNNKYNYDKLKLSYWTDKIIHIINNVNL
jgi:hypothetical protein